MRPRTPSRHAAESGAFSVRLTTGAARPGFPNGDILAAAPVRLLAAANGRLFEFNPAARRVDAAPLSPMELERRLGLGALAERGADLPDASCWFGYLGYEAAAWLAGAPTPIAPGPRDLPDLWLMLPGRLAIASPGETPPEPKPLSAKQRDEADWLDAVFRAAMAPAAAPISASAACPPEETPASAPPGLSDPAAHRRAIDRTREYLFAGDIYQANITRRVATSIGADAERLYGELLAASPASHAALLKLGGGFQIASASPELFLRLRRDGLLETRPIKGTLRKDGMPGGPERLRASEKDLAEHVMIVDLERNDLGRVALPGTVRPASLFDVLDLPALYHLESAIEARPRPGVGPLEATLALFPGGSITGAPKRRAMEIIRELEPARRNAYTGAIGWIGANSLHLSIAIRTLYRTAAGGWHYHVGGGVVADSTPEGEWAETETKALGMEAALRAAGAGPTPPS